MLASQSSQGRFARYQVAGFGGLAVIIAGLWLGGRFTDRPVVESGQTRIAPADIPTIADPPALKTDSSPTPIVPTARFTFVEAVPVADRDSAIQPVGYRSSSDDAQATEERGIVLATFEETAVPPASSAGPATFRGDIEPLETSR